MPGSGKQQTHGFGQIQGYEAVEPIPRHSRENTSRHRFEELGCSLHTSTTTKVSRCPTAIALLTDCAQSLKLHSLQGKLKSPRRGVKVSPTCPTHPTRQGTRFRKGIPMWPTGSRNRGNGPE